VNYPPQIDFDATPEEEARMIVARIKWLRSLGEAGMPWPGEAALSGFASGFLIALRNSKGA